MPDQAFDQGSIRIRLVGMAATEARLTTVARGLTPEGVYNTMQLAVGGTHRYMMGLKRSGTPPTQTGILPVVTSRLANSFFMGVRRAFGSITGQVVSNIIYGPPVEARRGFVARTLRDQTPVVRRLFADHAKRLAG